MDSTPLNNSLLCVVVSEIYDIEIHGYLQRGQFKR